MAFDTSEYRASTYGNPDYYCDVTKAATGTGTLLDPWNLTQALSAPGGSVVGFPRVGSGTIQQLAAPTSSNTPAFNVVNSGTSGSPTVFVTQYAASYLTYSLGKASVGASQDRTELRHAGAAATITAGGAGGTGDTGGPIIGANGKNYIIFDGFYFDMSQCEIREDSGVIRTQDSTGITVKNFAIKGKTVGVASNCVIYRPGGTINDTLSNFYVWGFHNSGTAGGNNTSTPQPALFSDQYGSQNFTLEHFDIDDCDRGIFCKGAAAFDRPTELNYGTIQYGKISNTSMPFAFNAMGTTVTNVRHVLAYDTYEQIGGLIQFSGDGIAFDTISSGQQRNVAFDHVTIAKVVSGSNTTAAFYVDTDNGLNAGSNGVTLTNSILDVDSGSFGFLISVPNTNVPQSCNYNYYTKNGSSVTFSRNGVDRTFTQWKSDTGYDANSQEGSTSPFTNRTSNDYTISGSHAAYTMSSTGGQIGAYGGTSETIGVDVTPGGGGGGSTATIGPAFLM